MTFYNAEFYESVDKIRILLKSVKNTRNCICRANDVLLIPAIASSSKTVLGYQDNRGLTNIMRTRHFDSLQYGAVSLKSNLIPPS
jgi:hypothetical protein